MKVLKLLNITARLDSGRMVGIDEEIPLEISGAEVVAAILEDDADYKAEDRLKRVLNNLAAMLKGFSDDTIAALTPAARAMLHKFLIEQAERFA